jgi:hypothetical protein
VTGLFALGAPVASAQIWPGVGTTANIGGLSGPSGCASNAPAGTGPAGGTTGQACGEVLSYIGPAIGEVASVIGPNVIGVNLAPIVVSAGPVGP